ncbi:MAG: hypothetical protein EOO42_20850, partial [Flavobacteriales bacterium]
MVPKPGLSFQKWDSLYSRFGGMMVKSLNEEIARSSNIPWIRKFKQNHPSQMALLHYNGNARDPLDAKGDYFAGHWLYYAGSKLLTDLKANEQESVVRVQDAKIYKTKMGRNKDANEDIGLCELNADGTLNWNKSEQVKLISVDLENNTITVKRAQYGTAARAFTATKSWAASHVTEGPWGKPGSTNGLLWLYNYASTCPKNGNGKTCSEVLIQDLVRHLKAGGDLDYNDGVTFDVLYHEINGLSFGRQADVNADGKGDNGSINGVNLYGIGVYNFCKEFRKVMGNEFIIIADGMITTNQRAVGILNGMENEGWPSLRDPEMDDWSGGLNRNLFWIANTTLPSYTYINHKYLENLKVKPADNIQRLILAVAQQLRIPISTGVQDMSSPAPEPGELFGVWDELKMGTANKKYWLGKAIGAAKFLGRDQKDMLNGDGVKLSPVFVSAFTGADLVIKKEIEGVKISASRNGDMMFGFPKIATRDMDLLITFKVKSMSRKNYPAAMPRLLTMNLNGGVKKTITWVNNDWFEASFYCRDLK